jgi:serine/threonine protein kinase
VKIHEAYEDHFKIYMIVDDCNGESLFNRIIRLGQLGEQESAVIISHVFSAVKYMHKNGIIHRNIRPEMIIFQSENAMGDIKLFDFISAI